MFGSVLTAIGALLHIYAFWRISSVPFLRRHMRRRTIAAIGLAVGAFFVIGRTLSRSREGAAFDVLQAVCMAWMASVFLVCVCLVATEVVTCGGFLLRRYAPVLRGWALVAGAVLSAFAVIQGQRAPLVQSYEVELAGLPEELDGTVVVGLSDLHLDSPRDRQWLSELVAQVNAMQPSLVVLLGDILEGRAEGRDELIAGLNELSAPLGVWAVPGNHEHYGARSAPPFPAASVQLLLNRWVEVRRGLVLAGVEDLTTAQRRGREARLVEQALAGRPPGATLLLSHTPWEAETAAAHGAALMLSGHTHGGQIWPMKYLVRLRYPLVEGRYQVGGMTVLVCRGTGTWGPPMRLWRAGEIMHVTLRTGGRGTAAAD